MALMFGALAGNVPVWQVEYRFAGFTKQLIELGGRIVADLKKASLRRIIYRIRLS